MHLPIGVSRYSILSFTGMPEPSGKECQEGSYRRVYNNTPNDELKTEYTLKQSKMSLIVMATKPLPSLQPFVDWYLKSYLNHKNGCISHRDAFVNNINNFRKKVLSGTLSDQEIVDLFFKNNHFWALKSFYKYKVYIPVRNEFERLRPWTLILGSFQKFEDLYSWLESKLQPLGATQLVIYDLSLWLSALDPSGNLLPRDNVYVHATPMKAYKMFYAKGYFKHHPKQPNDIILRTVFLPQLDQLTAYEIEDLLCHIGKCIREIENEHKNTPKPCVKTNKPVKTGMNSYDELMKITNVILF